MPHPTSPKRAEFTATIISTALEGGIGYWSGCVKYQWRYPDLGASSDAAAEAARQDTGDNTTAWARATVIDAEDASIDGERDTEQMGITQTVIERALRRIRAGEAEGITAAKRTRILAAHFTNDAADLDASDAYVIVQLGLFGSIYG